MPDWLLYASIFLATFFGMEGIAWVMHKYVMHGFLWSLHKSHHEPKVGFWELNDVFGLVFALVSILPMTWALRLGGPLWALFVGAGITAYGAVYFFAHDILVHKRVALRINPKKGYLRRLYQSHRLHHAVDGKAGCVSFGFVFAPSPDRLKKQLQTLAPLREHQKSKVDINRSTRPSAS